MSRMPRQLIARHFDKEAAFAAARHKALDDRRRQHRADNSGDVKAEQDQPLQSDARADH
jgi:hypothetical protein